jgi:hypothetical protein
MLAGTIFIYVTKCTLAELHRRFAGEYCFHVQVPGACQANEQGVLETAC